MNRLPKWIALAFAMFALLTGCANSTPPLPTRALSTTSVPATIAPSANVSNTPITILSPTIRNSSTATALPIPTPTFLVERKVSYVSGSSKKICQLTGENDRQLNQPTLNRTLSRYGVRGTDLGYSFEHDGKVFFLFGDTPGPRAKFDGADSIAFSSDTDPEDCLAIDFVSSSDKNFLPPIVPGITQGGYEVPNGGLSANGKMYVIFSTDRTGNPDALGRSVMGRSDNHAQSFLFLYEVSRAKFITVAPVIVNNADVPGVPLTQGQGVLFWGTALHRQSNAFLAYTPLNGIEDRKSWRFFAGMQAGAPRWSEDESVATPLFNHPCIGEISVTRNPFLNKWLMLYNCREPRGINFRVADHPWGPWSPTQVLFDPMDDNGYCHFIHLSWEIRKCDELAEGESENISGGNYAPYVISRFTRGNANQTTLYYVMSTWRPYQVVLMKSILQLK